MNPKIVISTQDQKVCTSYLNSIQNASSKQDTTKTSQNGSNFSGGASYNSWKRSQNNRASYRK